MPATNELKPCPFCGSEAEMVKGEVNEPIFWVSCKCCQCETIWFETEKEAIELANGVIVPPCKVGDIVWFYDDFMWGLLPCRVDRPYHCVCGEDGGCTFSANFTDDDFGKTVFLTKEEAEKALKERENSGNGYK